MKTALTLDYGPSAIGDAEVIMAGLTIGIFARAVGVRPDTIRYYERNGLLPRPARSSAGYRLFAESDLERVRFIRKAQQLGFTLAEIGLLLTLQASDTARAAGVLEITEKKIADCTSRAIALNRIKDALERLAAECPVDAPASDCPILAHLASASGAAFRARETTS